MRENIPIRVCWLVGLLLLAVPLGLRSIVLAVTPIEHLRDIVDFVYDDGYYYLTVAANLAHSGHSTFDGITATNGYQPLWLLSLTALAKPFGAQPYTYFFATCVLVYAIALGTPILAVFARRGTERDLLWCFGAGLALVMVWQQLVFLRGLEPILFAPLLMVLIPLMERARTDSAALLQISAALSVAFLIRLDALAVYASLLVGLTLLVVLSEKRSAAATAAVVLRVSAFVIPTVLVYAALNQWLFDSPVPVSGLAKFVGGARFTNWGAALLFFKSVNALLVLIAILAALELAIRRAGTRPAPLFYRSIIVVSVSVALQVFYYCAFSTWYVWPWYTYLVATDAALIIARIIYVCGLLLGRTGTSTLASRAVAIAALLFLGAWASRHTLMLCESSLPAHHKEAGMTYNQASLAMLDTFFPAQRHTLIAMGDRGGGLAYWGHEHLSVVQTEGILLDMGYIRARQANRGAQYLERFPIEYLVTDREVVPTLQGPDGQVLYVIPDPIQGRVSFEPVPTFCFPASAVRYRRAYPATNGATNERLAFLFAARVPCPAAAISLVRSIETGVGLRQYSLPTEYDPANSDSTNKSSEDRDRRHALQP